MKSCSRHGGRQVTRVRQSRCAVLVLAESSSLFSARRGWGENGTPAAGALVNHAIAAALRSAIGDVHVFSRGHGGEATPNLPLFGCRWHRQSGQTFGHRLEAAVAAIRQMGYQRVVIVGTDVPGLRAAHLRQAAKLLDGTSLVLGADHRGGCYAIALHLSEAHVIRDVTWGRDTDFAQLLSRRPDAAVLPHRLGDIDYAADLRAALHRSATPINGRLATLLQALLMATSQPKVAWLAVESFFRPARLVALRVWQLPPPVAA